MEFQSGDEAVHPGYGLGRIERLEERQLVETGRCLYYVMTIGGATVWVPIHADGSSALRAVTSRLSLDRSRALLADQPVALDRDPRLRRQILIDRLKPGRFEDACEVVRDLSALGWGKPMNELDGTLLKTVRDKLCREWAAAGGTTTPEADAEIRALLQAARRTYYVEPPVSPASHRGKARNQAA